MYSKPGKKNKHKMTIDLVDILDKNCPLRTPEMAFQRIKSSKYSGGECPQTFLAARPFSVGLVKKISWFYSLKRLISIHLVLIDQIFFWGGGGWKRLLNFGLTSKSVDGFIYCDCLNKFRNYFEITFAYY